MAVGFAFAKKKLVLLRGCDPESLKPAGLGDTSQMGLVIIMKIGEPSYFNFFKKKKKATHNLSSLVV